MIPSFVFWISEESITVITKC